MLNIVIPMAGLGSRFSEAGYSLPKPLIDVRGRPMIQVVIENLRPTREHRFIFICQASHLHDYKLEPILMGAGAQTVIIPLDFITEGAACTVLLASDYINNSDPLMIANCDQYITASIDSYLNLQDAEGYDGLIMTMTAADSKWSFLEFGESNAIKRIVEKKVVSNEATVGIYNYARGEDFVNASHQMFNANDRTNGEFYVAPAYNYMISSGHKIGYANIGSDRAGMYGLGVPSDLEFFNSLETLPVYVVDGRN